MPGVSLAHEPSFENLEPDARLVPWSTVRRLALASGKFEPAYRSITSRELAGFMELSKDNENRSDRLTSSWWRARFLDAGGGHSWTGCECKTHPYSLRVQGRLLTGFTELGDVVPFEAGLAWAPGWNTSFEPVVDWSAGAFWATMSARLTGRMATGGQSLHPDEPLMWPGWSIPTGRNQVRQARLRDDVWLVQVPQFLVGAQLGNWSLSGGWAARRTGPGLTGVISLDQHGATFPAVTARRTSPFQWNGFMKYVAPDNLLLRAGQLSERTVKYKDNRGNYEKSARPWFFQWLLGWDVFPWFRTTFTHTVMATAREGTLWPDLIQINFPLIGTTWREQESGPITDRVFSVQMEFRWRHAPWPVLPSQSGRLFWDYAGTDFLPTGPYGVVPQISLPASVAGFELFSPSWDLGCEYSETIHDKVLWYSNSGYPEGYSQDGWVLAHPNGGAAESWTGLVRLRPAFVSLETEIKASWMTWKHPKYLPGTGKRNSLSIAVGGRPELGDRFGSDSPLLWQVVGELVEETADPKYSLAHKKAWWRCYLKLGI